MRSGLFRAMSTEIRVLLLTSIACATGSFILTLAAQRLGRRLGLLDVPNERSSHQIPTPRTGGIAIVLSVLACFFVARFEVTQTTAWWLVAGAAAMAVMGVADDVSSLRPSLRLVVQCIVTLYFLLASRSVLQTIALPFVRDIPLGVWSIPATLLWMVGMTNIFNFMDGIDGIAASEAVIAAATFAALFVWRRDFDAALLAALIAAGAIGFLPFNFPRASVFMGDGGSAALGFLLSGLAVRLAVDDIPFVGSILPLAPFALDGSVTLLRRAWGRENVLRAHRDHYYQRLVRSGLSHATVTSIWGALALLGSVAAMAYPRTDDLARAALLIAVAGTHAAAGIVTHRRAKLQYFRT